MQSSFYFFYERNDLEQMDDKRKRDGKRDLMLKTIVLITAGFTAVGMVKSIFVSLDIDESYAVAQAYRLAMGDRLFKDMWEPHQLSAVLLEGFIRLYLLLFHRVDYLVIALRVLGILGHVLLGGLLCLTLKKIKTKRWLNMTLFFLHVNYLPKWVQMPEFELMHYWGICLIGIFMVVYFEIRIQKWWIAFATGLFLILCMLCYPTMLLLYPGYLLGWVIMERGAKGAVWMTIGSGIGGMIFLGYIFSYQSVEEFLENVSRIFMDKSHTTYTMAQKWIFYLEQFREQMFICGIVFFVSLLFMGMVFFFSKKKRKMMITKKKRWEAFLMLSCILAGVILQLIGMCGFLFQDKNQFYFQVRYLALILPAIYLSLRYHKQLSIWFYAFVLPSVLSFFAVLFVTNMDTNVTYSKMFLGVIGSLIIYGIYFQKILENIELADLIQGVLWGSILLNLLICRLLLIRVTGCRPISIKAHMERMESGAEKGIYVLEEQARIWNQNYALLEKWVSKEDKVLYIGAENLIYLRVGARLATPSTQGTNVYDDSFLTYYELYPDKIPDVILIDKTYATNEAYGNYFGWEPVKKWVKENYVFAERMETEYMIILRKESKGK